MVLVHCLNDLRYQNLLGESTEGEVIHISVGISERSPQRSALESEHYRLAKALFDYAEPLG